MKKLAFHLSNSLIFLNPQDIIFITRKDRKSVIYTIHGSYAINEPLGKLEQILNGEMFFRCHKGYIVNVEKVVEFSPWGNKTYLVKLMDTSEIVLTTLEKAKEFRHRYCLE